MTLPMRHTMSTLLGISLIMATGCAGSSLGESVQKSLEADPQLADNPAFEQAPPTQFPENGEDAVQEANDHQETTAESPASVPRGEVVPPADRIASPGDDQSGIIDESLTSDLDNSSDEPHSTASSPGDISQVPEELRPYIKDLRALDLLPPLSDSAKQAGQIFQPNQTITRGEYAQWLFTANNRFYADQPTKKIRAGVANTQPAFEDVPPSHPQFAAIQGLAEAGLIPSALTGNSTAVTFRPDAPLIREDLVLWKVPLDRRGGLPEATVPAVEQVWGFQDTAKIAPLALRAVLADYQSGDFANIRRAFGYTTLFQPDKAVTQAEAAAVLWRFGSPTEGISAAQLQHPSSMSSQEPTSQNSEENPGDSSS